MCVCVSQLWLLQIAFSLVPPCPSKLFIFKNVCFAKLLQDEN